MLVSCCAGIRRQFKRKAQVHRPVRDIIRHTPVRQGLRPDILANTSVEISVTAIVSGTDMPLEMFNSIEAWMKQHTSQGLFSYERDGVNGNGHAQGIVRTNGILPGKFTSMLKLHLTTWARNNGISADLIRGIGVQSKRLSGQGIHTWLGMVGYCTKDIKLPHFVCLIHNISKQELESGRMEHIMRGAGPLKKRAALTFHTLLPKV